MHWRLEWYHGEVRHHDWNLDGEKERDLGANDLD
jgi:hypothetical protein